MTGEMFRVLQGVCACVYTSVCKELTVSIFRVAKVDYLENRLKKASPTYQ
jgi:hypothetical protein